MIILLRALLISSFFTFFNKKNTPFFLLFIVIIMSFNLSGIFLVKELSFLGLLWILVYLGGMIVIFIYICFLFKYRDNKMENQNHFFFKKKNILEIINLIGVRIFFIRFYPTIVLKKPEIAHSSCLSILDWEVYNSITVTRLRFIMVLITIILISLINILRLLKKSFLFYQKNNIL